MGNFKINCGDENQNFIPTQSYQELLRSFAKLKKQRGNILHVVGAPGVGKSANIYQASAEVGLIVYEASLILNNEDVQPKRVFELTLNSVKNDLGVKTDRELYSKLEEFDMILIADRFHDSHLLNPDTVGFSQWSANKGWSAYPYYWYCLEEYLKRKNEFRNLNVVFQTSWRVYLGGRKRDLFTELGIISKISIGLLKIPFQVVEIAYSPLETINIVKSHFHYVDEDRIKKGIDLFDCKPRFICEALKTEKI
jgi:Cdc6-like AAA superfamily ATPase